MTLSAQSDTQMQRIALVGAPILVDITEPSYVQFAAQDLASYLEQISGVHSSISSSPNSIRNTKVVVAVGKAMALACGVNLKDAGNLGREGAFITSFERTGTTVVAIAGADPHGTNMGVATLIQRIRVESKMPYLEGPIALRSQPSIAVRGFHMNGGWQLNHPYGFRTWTEADWKHFVDIVWAQRGNLIFIWPYVEAMVVPLSPADKAYLEEFRRITDYAQKQRGMEVWIMQAANRVALTDCNVPDPMLRPHWINGCQKDMDPADAEQFAKIEKSFEALYREVNNADGFCLIDSDPGGWPQSSLSDQLKIFLAARKLLNQYNLHGEKAKLVDWMWIGWGRHKFFTSTDRLVTGFDWTDKNPDESDVAFMADTIRNFKDHLPEPWEMVAGMPPYLESAKRESAISRTVFLPYGEIEMEPAFPATNMGFQGLRKVLDKEEAYPDLRGWMGNNELMLLQFPRSFYYLNSLWDLEFRKREEKDVLQEIARQLYPESASVVGDSFLALQEKDPQRIDETVQRLGNILRSEKAPPAGAIGRFVFPDRLIVLRNLKMQLEIRRARQRLIKALDGRPSVEESRQLVETYFDKLLAWNKETGWEKTIDIVIWTSPIYEDGKDLHAAMTRLKEILGEGAPYTTYSQVNSFFDPISKSLLKKYGQDSVMVGCIDPFKLAVAQSQ